MIYVLLSSFVLMLEYNITIGNITFDLLPDVIGYMLLLKGIETSILKKELEKEQKWYQIIYIVSFIYFILQIFGLLCNSFIINTIFLICNLISLFMIKKKLMSMEEDGKVNICSKFISFSYSLLLMSCILKYLYLFVPALKIPFIVLNIMGVLLFAFSIFNAWLRMKKRDD